MSCCHPDAHFVEKFDHTDRQKRKYNCFLFQLALQVQNIVFLLPFAFLNIFS